MLVDDFLPVYDVSDSVATTVAADVARTWEALMAVDLIDVGRRRPLVGVLGALRGLPDIAAHLLHGEAAPGVAQDAPLARDRVPPIGPRWLGAPGRAARRRARAGPGREVLAPGHHLRSGDPGRVSRVRHPRYAKTVYSLSVRALGERQTLLSGVMRTATTDDQARRWFRRYWALGVGSGAHLLVDGLLDVTRAMAEQSP